MKKPFKKKTKAAALLFLLPAIVAVLFILVYPIIYGMFMGLTDRLFSYDVFSFVGLDNFVEIFSDPLFFKALGNTLKMVFYLVLLNTLMGFVLALLLNSSEGYIGFFRTLFFMPWIMPSAVVAFSFRWLYNDYYGLINHLLVSYGLIDAAVNPLAREGLVWPGVIIPSVWFSYPFVMLVMSAALKSIDSNVMDAARIDGASRWQIFRDITMPSLMPTIKMLVVLQIIWEFSSFDLIYLLTRGGPANSTLTLSLYIFRRAFQYKQIGYACALATVMFIVLSLFIAIYFRLSQRGETDED